MELQKGGSMEDDVPNSKANLTLDAEMYGIFWGGFPHEIVYCFWLVSYGDPCSNMDFFRSVGDAEWCFFENSCHSFVYLFF